MFNKMPLSLRLAGGFFVVTLLAVIVAALGFISIKQLNDDVDSVVNNHFPKVVETNDIVDQVNGIARMMRDAMLADTVEDAKKEIARLDEPRKVIVARLEKLEKTIQSEKGKAQLKATMDARTIYRAQQDEFTSLLIAGKRNEAKASLMGPMRAAQDKYLAAISQFIDYETQRMAEVGKEAADSANSAERMMMIFGAIAVALASIIAFLLTRSVLKQLGGDPSYVVSCMKHVEEGNLG
ncbi:MAG: MCP four helix bundle domain-containing protein, partial [Rhodocyclaceae bacterium]